MKDYYKDKYSDLLDDYYELTNKYLELSRELLKFVEVKKTDEELAASYIETRTYPDTFSAIAAERAFIAGRKSRDNK